MMRASKNMTGLWRLLAGICLAAVVCSCRSAPPAPLPAAGKAAPAGPSSVPLPSSYFLPYDPGTFRLSIGDVVEVSVFGCQDTLAVTPIAPDGKLYYLFVNGIPAAGRTPAEVANEIEKGLAQLFNQPSVSVLPKQFARNRFLALGKVAYPASYPLESALTVRQALARAGGLAQGFYRGTTIQLALLKESYLLRNGVRLPLNLEALVNKDDVSQDIYMRPGDVLYIASGLGQEVYLMGAVSEQRATAYTDGMTLVQLVSGSSEQGGGYRPEARLSQVLILRGALDDPRTSEVNLARILKGKDPDVTLLPGDIVYIPEKPFRFASDLARTVVLTFVRTFASEYGVALVQETFFPPATKTTPTTGGTTP